MKYKLAGAAVMIAALVLSLLVPLRTEEKNERVYQHLLPAAHGAGAEDTKGTFCTYLPLVLIDTDGAQIPGKRAQSDAGELDSDKTVTARMDIIDNRQAYNDKDDAPAVSSRIKIRVRGSSSRYFEKSSYELRLIGEDGANNPCGLMGMDAHHEWALYGPYLDKTLLRNYLCYNLAGEMMDYAPNVRFCEVLLNGAYQGVYVMTETITAGNGGARLALDVDKASRTYTGYALRLTDRTGEAGNLGSFSQYAMRTDQRLEIVYPGKANITPQMARSVRDDFSMFEKALYSYDYDSRKYGYRKYIDAESFADYFLLNELTGNTDAGTRSTYIYKGADNRYRMCVWDFNNAFDNYPGKKTDTNGFFMTNCVWYMMLLKDEDFTKQLVERYRILRKTVFDEAYLMGLIDDTAAYLEPAAQRDFKLWGAEPADKKDAVRHMKTWLAQRICWMDENIETLYQYSAESAVKKFNENPR